jgi:hypothetical protein
MDDKEMRLAAIKVKIAELARAMNSMYDDYEKRAGK